MAVITSSKARVIDLAELRSGERFPCWAAIYSRGPGNPFVLSPSAMHWREGIYLSRPGECSAFWLEQKKKLRCKLTDLLTPLLRDHLGEDFIAVLGNHPWQCLWYLEYQRRQQARGLYLLQSPLDANIYLGLDWDSWFDLQDGLADHLEAINARGFHRGRFASRQAQMRRFIERGEIGAPHAMRAADANSIQRRFGAWLGRIWQWSFSADNGLQGFPWRAWSRPEIPAVKRELEYPVNQWSYIELLLREDLSRLAERVSDTDCVHINRMTWDVSLFNDERVRVELAFRHPYSLHRDQPGFATALYQARYIFDDLMRKLRARDCDLDLPPSMPFTAWRLEIRERVILSPRLWDLFANEAAAPDYERVKSLQNKLPVAFESYRPEASFYPEQSFAARVPGESTAGDFDYLAWCCAADKPLFYHPSAQPIEEPGRACRRFLERSSVQWWLDGQGTQAVRDYYIVKDGNGRSIWVYRTLDGNWFKQGDYH